MLSGRVYEARRVLVGEDVPGIARLIGRLIEREGAEVVYTSNGDDVMRILIEERIDALVVDNRMPGRWGVEIALALLETRPDLPIIITTANALGVIAPKNVLLVVDKSELPKMLDTLRWAIGLYPEAAVSSF